MKRIIVICEGGTEEEFFSKTVYKHFILKNIHIQPINTKGIKPWEAIKDRVILKLKESSDVYVTTFYDFYGISPNHKFPGWVDSENIVDKNSRLDFLESEMKKAIPEVYQDRFFPYLQLHEFEGLLFNNIRVFQEQIPQNDLIGIKELVKTFQDYPDNPEMINDSQETAPSYRLKRIINGYDKIVYGNILFDAIGLQNIRSKSPRFHKWLLTLENI